MTQESRLKRLEKAVGSAKDTVIAIVPDHWSEDEIQAGMISLKQSHAVPADLEVCLIKDQKCTDAEMAFAGDLDDLLNHVAKHSRRIGLPNPEAQNDDYIKAPKYGK